MKNIRTQRSSDQQKDDKKATWVGNHKYCKDCQLKTSRGDYK